MSQLPPRFRESAFRFYEPYIKLIVEEFPRPCVFDMTVVGLSSVTFSCRLRDAIRSLRENHWNTSIPDSFWDIADNIIISDQGKTVWCGDKTSPREGRQSPTQVTSISQSSPKTEMIVTNVAEFVFLLTMANSSKIPLPVLVKWESSDPVPTTTEIDWPNIAVVFEPPNIFRII